MRVGKFLEHFQAALKATSIQDPFVSYTAIGRQLGYGGYLIFDTLQWVSTGCGGGASITVDIGLSANRLFLMYRCTVPRLTNSRQTRSISSKRWPRVSGSLV